MIGAGILFVGFAYRYGFNGKEKDTDGEWGNQTHYDYGFRIYNPGIGKFMSVDPLTKSYPELTPYQFAHNSPISAIDMDGLEAEGTNKKVDNSLKHKEGLTFFGNPNTVISYVRLSSVRGADGKYIYKSKTLKNDKYSATRNTMYNFNPFQGLARTSGNLRNGNELAYRFMKHFALAPANEAYKMTIEEMKLARPLSFGLQGGFGTRDPILRNILKKKYSAYIDGDRNRFIETFKSYNIGETKPFIGYVTTGAIAKGTLGKFQVIFQGDLTRTGLYSYSFRGTYSFRDRWDFNKEDDSSQRSWFGNRAVEGMRSTYGDRGFGIISVNKPFNINNMVPPQMLFTKKKR